MNSVPGTPGSMTGLVRTVLGDIEPSTLGRVNYHEHLFQRSPLLPDDDLDDEGRSRDELALLRDSGFDAMIDATPVGLGRNPEAVSRLSLSTQVTVVATTGRHRDAHYSDQAWAQSGNEALWEKILVHELTCGMAQEDEDYAISDPDRIAVARSADGEPIRAGLLKAGIDYWQISPAEHSTLAAVATAYRATGAPVMVHTEWCSAAMEVLDLLSKLGVPESRVVIAHADRNPDPGLHSAIAERGAYLGYDGAGRHKTWPDSVLLDAMTALVNAGYVERILLGADVARRRRYRSYGGLPGLGYLGNSFLPRIRQRMGPEVLQQLIVQNPATYLAWK
jgi:predicted metal-dependent phosphotriesterase family hydrolase